MFSYIKSWFAGPPPLSPEFLENLKKDTVTDKVVVYSKTYCPYCTSTKNLFQGLGQEFKLACGVRYQQQWVRDSERFAGVNRPENSP